MSAKTNIKITAQDQASKVVKQTRFRINGELEAIKQKMVSLPAAMGIGAIVAGVTLSAKKSLDEFQKFETALVDMGKVTEEPLESIKKRISSIGPELGNATELVKGYYQTISAGIADPVKATNFLTIASKASKAAHTSQSDTIKALTKLMAGYKGEIKDVTTASDALFQIEKLGQTSFKELVPVIGNVANSSNMAKIELDEMGASLALLTQTAGSTSQAETQYQALVMGFIKPTERLVTVLKQAGYESGTALIDDKGFVGALKFLKNQAEETGLGIGKLFESKEAITGIEALLSNNGNKLVSFIDEMGQKAGKTDKAFKDWEETLSGIKTTFYNTIGNFAIEFGEKLAPSMKKGMQDITVWMQENKDGLIGGFETIGVVVKETTQSIATWVVWIGKVKSSLDNLGGKVETKEKKAINWQDNWKQAKTLSKKGLLDFSDFEKKSWDEQAKTVQKIHSDYAKKYSLSIEEAQKSIALTFTGTKESGAAVKLKEEAESLSKYGMLNYDKFLKLSYEEQQKKIDETHQKYAKQAKVSLLEFQQASSFTRSQMLEIAEKTGGKGVDISKKQDDSVVSSSSKKKDKELKDSAAKKKLQDEEYLRLKEELTKKVNELTLSPIENQKIALREEKKILQESTAYESATYDQKKELNRIFNEYQKEQMARVQEEQKSDFQKTIEQMGEYYGSLERMNLSTATALRDTMQDVFFDAMTFNLKGAEEYFKSFTKMILSSLSQIMANKFTSSLLSGLFSGPNFGATGGGGNVAPVTDSSGFTVGGLATGGVYYGGRITRFAGGGVVNSPTYFPTLDGAGLMGEAGAEAIMPLTRLKNGVLGVRSESSGGGSVVHHHHYNIQAIDAQSFNEMLKKQGAGAIIETVIEDIESAGALRDSIKGA